MMITIIQISLTILNAVKTARRSSVITLTVVPKQISKNLIASGKLSKGNPSLLSFNAEISSVDTHTAVLIQVN